MIILSIFSVINDRRGLKMKREKLENAVFILVGVVFGAIIFMFAFKKLLPVFFPFIIAWTVAFAVREPAKRLSASSKIPESVLRVSISLFVIIIAFGSLALLVWQLSALLWRFLSGIDENSPIFSLLEDLASPSLPFFGDIIPPGLGERLSEALNSLISSILTRLGESLTAWVSLIPSALFFALVTVISLVYFCLDLERINAAVKSFLPLKLSEWLSRFRREAFAAIGKYFRSYLIILLMTFAVMLAGFLILRVENAVLAAIIVAFLDILPVIGVGTVLLPWSILAFMMGNAGRGIGLIVLFLVNTVIRQFSEPKIVGKSLDLHPVLTLISLYVGLSLFGIAGLAFAPLVAVGFSLFKNNGTAEIDKTSLGE